jgi:hypothetical protein
MLLFFRSETLSSWTRTRGSSTEQSLDCLAFSVASSRLLDLKHYCATHKFQAWQMSDKNGSGTTSVVPLSFQLEHDESSWCWRQIDPRCATDPNRWIADIVLIRASKLEGTEVTRQGVLQHYSRSWRFKQREITVPSGCLQSTRKCAFMQRGQKKHYTVLVI